MQKHTALALAVATLASIGACASPAADTEKQVDTSADVAEIRRLQDRELETLSGGNIDSMVANYTSDIVMMAPDAPIVNNATELRAAMEAMLKEASHTGKYASADVEVHGDIAIVRYTGSMTTTPKAQGAKPTTHSIKGIHVYRREADGKWKIARDVWNNDPPAAAGGN